MSATTITVRTLTFCENCAKHRDVALVRVGQWFIWMCIPCQFQHTVKRAWRRLKEEWQTLRSEWSQPREDR